MSNSILSNSWQEGKDWEGASGCPFQELTSLVSLEKAMDSVHFALSDKPLIIVKHSSSSLRAESIDKALAVFIHADCRCLGRMLFKGPCCQHLLPELGETGLMLHRNYWCWCQHCLQDTLTHVIWRSKIGLSDPLRLLFACNTFP